MLGVLVQAVSNFIPDCGGAFRRMRKAVSNYVSIVLVSPSAKACGFRGPLYQTIFRAFKGEANRLLPFLCFSALAFGEDAIVSNNYPVDTVLQQFTSIQPTV